MNRPQSVPETAIVTEDVLTTKDDTETTENENGDGATTTSTQPDDDGPAAAATPAVLVTASTAPSQTEKFVYHPNKITLKFIFANRDGLNVILDCRPADTVGEVKGALLSLWPEDMPECSDGDRLRLICMGKGILMPDSKTLGSLDVPVFKTHATPVNVAVRPEISELSTKSPPMKNAATTSPARGGNNSDSVAGAEVSTGCSCAIL